MLWYHKLFGHFVDDWKQAWKWTSVQLLAIVTLLATYFVENPTEWGKIMAVIPESIKPVISVLFGVLVLYTRLRKQTSDSK